MLTPPAPIAPAEPGPRSPAPAKGPNTWALVIFLVVLMGLMLAGGIAVFASLAPSVGTCGGG